MDFTTILTDLANRAKTGAQQILNGQLPAIPTIPGLNQDFEEVVAGVTIESAYGPTIHIDRPLVKNGVAEESPFWKLIQPRVTVRFAPVVGNLGIKDFVIQPYGRPPPTQWPVVETAVVAGGILLSIIILRGVFR